MPTYTAIPNTQIEPEAPVTSELMTLLRDNPLSIIEDDSTAPKIKQRMRYGQSVGGNITFSDLANYGGVEITAGVREISGTDTATLEMQYSTNNGSSYTTITNIVTAPDPDGVSTGHGYFDFATGELSIVSDRPGATYPGFTTTVGGAPLAITNLRFVVSTGDYGTVIIKAFGGVS